MSGLADAILNLENVYTRDDHDRRCPARSNAGGCTCGYDERFETAMSRVFTCFRSDDLPLKKAEVDDLMVLLSREVQPAIDRNSPLITIHRHIDGKDFAKSGPVK